MDNRIQIIFYLKHSTTESISAVVSIEDFCEKDEEGNYYYEMEGQKIQFKSAETLAKVLYEGMIDSLDKYYEAKLNGGHITNADGYYDYKKPVATTFGFGNIIVPIESVIAVKINIIEDSDDEEEINEEDKVIVEMEED